MFITIKNKKIVSLLGFFACLAIVFAGQFYIDFIQSPEKLEAVDCSGGVFTTGDDTVTCTGTVQITDSDGLDFFEGDDVVTNDGVLTMNKTDFQNLSGKSVGDENRFSMIYTNTGNSNDVSNDTFINNGTTTASLDDSQSGTKSVILFAGDSAGNKTLTNNGLISVASDSDNGGYAVNFLTGGSVTVTNAGVIKDDASAQTGILGFNTFDGSNPGTSTVINSGTLGRSGNDSRAIFSRQHLTVLNTGTIYGGIISFSGSYTDIVTNRGVIDGVVDLDASNDTYTHNIAAASVTSVDGEGGTDTFCAEALDGEYEDFDFGDVAESGFENFCVTGGGNINYSDTTISYNTSVASSSILSASSSVAITGTLTLDDGDTDGTLYVTIDSDDTPTTTSRFTASGAATLAGTLKVVDTGAGAGLGDTYTFLDANSISGTFATTDLPTLATGLFWDVSYGDTSVTLTVADNAGSLTYSGGQGYDISAASFDAVALNVSGQETNPFAMLFNSDGTSLYVMGGVGEDINEYTLSTAYDISTATFDSVVLDVSGQETTPYSMLFNSDGTSLYVMGGVGEDINEYTLSTAYDISTATFDSVVLDVSGQETVPFAMLFNNDGTSLYVMGGVGDDINEYTLSTPYDISTATFDSIALSVSGQETTPFAMLFNNDGTSLYVMGGVGDDINEYTLSTPYDISTAIFDSVALDISGQEIAPYSMLFNNDGTSLYVMGAAGRDINEYTIPLSAGGTLASYQEATADDGSISDDQAIFITLSTGAFQDTDADNLLDMGSEVTINNVPAGLTPVMTLSENDTIAKLTFTGNATTHTTADNVSELTFVFDDTAFTAGDASAVTNSGDSTPYGTGVGITFTGAAPAEEEEDAEETEETVTTTTESSTPSGRRRSTSGSSSSNGSSTNTGGTTSGSGSTSSNVVEVLTLLRSLGLYDGPIPTDTCAPFATNQSIGDEGAEVSRIQSFLTTTNHFNFTVTGYFGSITQNAVKAFQAQYADYILTPLNLDAPTGNWYSFTRAKANEVECGVE